MLCFMHIWVNKNNDETMMLFKIKVITGFSTVISNEKYALRFLDCNLTESSGENPKTHLQRHDKLPGSLKGQIDVSLFPSWHETKYAYKSKPWYLTRVSGNLMNEKCVQTSVHSKCAHFYTSRLEKGKYMSAPLIQSLNGPSTKQSRI